jgi:hypothetical protein
MIGVCAGDFRPNFFFADTIIPYESNSHARRGVNIPDMGSELRRGTHARPRRPKG